MLRRQHRIRKWYELSVRLQIIILCYVNWRWTQYFFSLFYVIPLYSSTCFCTNLSLLAHYSILRACSIYNCLLFSMRTKSFFHFQLYVTPALYSATCFWTNVSLPVQYCILGACSMYNCLVFSIEDYIVLTISPAELCHAVHYIFTYIPIFK